MSRCRHFYPLEFSAAWRLEVKEADYPPFDLRAMFGNDAPLEIEIGHGKGTFLLEAALAMKDTNFLALEWSSGRHLYTAERVAKRNLGNVRLVRGDANLLFEKQIPAGSARTVHIYFPDPYWKKKHLKRKLINKPFLALLARVLKPGGRVLLKGDVAERFAEIRETFMVDAGFRPVSSEEAFAPYPVVVSSFERKATIAGRHVECAAYERIG